MKLSLCNEVLGDMPFEAQCEIAAELGYEGLELAPFTVVDDPRDFPMQKRNELRKAAEKAGIRISGLHWLLLAPKGLSITSFDDEIWNRTVDVMRACVEICGDLGGDVLVHGSPAQRRLPEDKTEDAKTRAIDAFEAIAGYAERAGVIYCIEALSPPQANFVTSVEEAVEIVGKIDSPAVRTMIDCAAVRRSGDTPVSDLIDRWLPQGMIAHIQVNDSNRQGPGQGDDEFASVITSLNRNGYNGWIAAEPFVYRPDGPTVAAYSAGYIKGLIDAGGAP